jgi:hypothetical protein
MIGTAMRVSRRHPLPLVPLLRAYVARGTPSPEELGRVPGLGERFRAVLAARGELLTPAFLDGASAMAFEQTLARFYTACVQPPLHGPTISSRAGLLRHALTHLMRCPDPLPIKAERCLAAGGPYHVAGLGPMFWSAVLQGLDPSRHAAWTPAVLAGLERLRLIAWRPHDGPAAVYAALLEVYDQIRSLAPSLSALHVDHFLTLVAAMHGRDLWSKAEHLDWATVDLRGAIKQERSGVVLRQRLKERGQSIERARRQLEAALAAQRASQIGAALALADPDGHGRARLKWKANAEAVLHWTGRLWEAADPFEILEAFWRLDPIPGAGLWLPAAVLHLRDAQRFQPWNEAIRQGFAAIDDSADTTEPTAERYRLFLEGTAYLCQQHRPHPLEISGLLTRLASGCGSSTETSPFGGFCADTFRFLCELEKNNSLAWMEEQRSRYHFVVREPLVEMGLALVERYIEPVLRRGYAWDLETTVRTGRVLSSICKNDYGRSVPYHTALWLTFYRRDRHGKRRSPNAEPNASRKQDEVQFFVRLDQTGLVFGLRLGEAAQEAGTVFRHNVDAHGEIVLRALHKTGALAQCRFGTVADFAHATTPANAEDLRAWAAGPAPMVARTVPASSDILTREELVGDILLTFDRLLPAYFCAAETEPLARLARWADPVTAGPSFTASDFCRATYLDADWLEQACALLALKRQLILQGVPGTGKTHVARCLAGVLTNGREESLQLVQFHPAYSYEEFVEGIKVRSVEVDGKHEVTYPVEAGLLCTFAAEAEGQPAAPHVLIIDEINRGNLPRIFGELLYLLEYRGQSIALPYSRRSFRLPENLYLIGTMNGADRSVALVDQALRRRFSFLEMPPDKGVLAAWLEEHPPSMAGFAVTVVTVFERLNALLSADLGPQYQVGHSYFMVPDLDESRLRVVWEHQVRPLLEEYFAGHPARLAAYALEKILGGADHRPDRRKRRTARVSG